MARFYFDVVDQAEPDIDDEGLELTDLAAAIAEATRAVREASDDHSIIIVVRDQHGRAATVTSAGVIWPRDD